MGPEELKSRNFEREFIFSATRSSGPGGQNVNKLNTRVELRMNIPESLILTEEEKNLIINGLKRRINKDGELIIVARSERSQLLNRKRAEEKFYDIVSKVLTPPEIRKATRPTAASVHRRLESKRIASVRKRNRRSGADYDTGE